jgi:hypothetical protein
MTIRFEDHYPPTVYNSSSPYCIAIVESPGGLSLKVKPVHNLGASGTAIVIDCPGLTGQAEGRLSLIRYLF